MNRTHRPFRQTHRRALVFCAALALLSGCHDSTAPLDSALSGRWVQYGIDSYSQFILEQHGARITGTFGTAGIGGPIGAPSAEPLSGTSLLGHVYLQWEQNGYHTTFEGALSEDMKSLVGRMAFDGQEAGPPATFTRQFEPTIY
jgi:hypothetical protein